MKVSVVPIGNSRGIRIPKAILKQLDICDQLEMQVERREIILRPIPSNPRSGWEERLREMSVNHDDELLIPENMAPEGFDWEW